MRPLQIHIATMSSTYNRWHVHAIPDTAPRLTEEEIRRAIEMLKETEAELQKLISTPSEQINNTPLTGITRKISW